MPRPNVRESLRPWGVLASKVSAGLLSALMATTPALAATIRVTGTVTDPTATVEVNGIPAAVDGAGNFTASLALSDGSHTITAVARNRANVVASSPSIQVIVDSQNPGVAITTPVAGVTVAGTILVVATASDVGSGVAGIQVLLDGTPLGPEDTTAPYQITWNTTASVNGQHRLSARARDAAGNTASSPEVAVTVNNSVGQPPPPPGIVNCYVKPTGNNASNGSSYLTAKRDPFACMNVITNGGAIIIWGNPWDDHAAYELTSPPLGNTLGKSVTGSGVAGAPRTLRGATATEDAAVGGPGRLQCPWLSGFFSPPQWFQDPAAGPNACGPGRPRWYVTGVAGAQRLRQYDLIERNTTRPADPCGYDSRGVPTFLTTNYLIGDYHRGTAIPNNRGTGKANVDEPGEWTQGDAGETDRIYYCPQGDPNANNGVVKIVRADDDTLSNSLIKMANVSFWTFKDLMMGGVTGEDGSGNIGTGALALNGVIRDLTLDRVLLHSAFEGLIRNDTGDNNANVAARVRSGNYVFKNIAIEYAHGYGINGNNNGACTPTLPYVCRAPDGLLVENARLFNLMQVGIGLFTQSGNSWDNVTIRNTRMGYSTRHNADGEDIWNGIKQGGRCIQVGNGSNWLVENVTCESPNSGGASVGAKAGSVVRNIVFKNFYVDIPADWTIGNSEGDEAANCFDITYQDGSVEDVTIENSYCHTGEPQFRRGSAYGSCFYMHQPNASPTKLTYRNNICVVGKASQAAMNFGGNSVLQPQSIIANNTFIQKDESLASGGCYDGSNGRCGVRQHNAANIQLAEFTNNIFSGFTDVYKRLSDASNPTQLAVARCTTNVTAPPASGIVPLVAIPNCTGAKTAAPSFVNRSGFDASGLHLAGSDTVARDAAQSLGGLFNADYDLDARPQGPAWDIGADEVRR